VLLFLHAGFMITGRSLMAAGVAVARLGRNNPWWLRIHKAAGPGGFSAVPGLSTAFYMVAESSDKHLDVLHARAGAAVIPPVWCLQG
jgi:hypothetical protein